MAVGHRGEELVKSAPYNYEEQIPTGFYDNIHRRKSGVRYFWHDLKFRSVAAGLPRLGKHLDIGCGPGTFIGNYLDDIEALGIDLSASQIGYANQHYSTAVHRFSTQSVDSLLDSGDRFDAITMIELAEHLAPDDAARLFAQTLRLLSPNGTLIVTTPNYRSAWPLIERAVNLVSPVSYEQQHINKYNRDRLLHQLSDAGYGNVTVKTIVGFAPFAAVFGAKPAQWLNVIEAGVGHLGCGNLLLATARP